MNWVDALFAFMGRGATGAPPVGGSRFSRSRGPAGVLGVLAAAFVVLAVGANGAAGAPKKAPRVIILGIDGMDYHLASQGIADGHLPHLARLAREGSFLPLQSTQPPLSPVAWTTFITGRNPGGHGVYDFLRRDPADAGPTLLPQDSVSQLVTKSRSWRLPASPYTWPASQHQELRRSGPAFWELLEKAGVAATVYKIPANFPATGPGRVLAGMGTPDLEGTYGTFTYLTSRPEDTRGNAGRVLPVQLHAGQVLLRDPGGKLLSLYLTGPPNPFRSSEITRLLFECYVDPAEKTALVRLPGQDCILQQGRWSNWAVVQFDLMPYPKSLKGFVRFYLQEAHPDFRLYVSPINLAAGTPGLATQHFDQELYAKLGPYFTKGMSEETKALLQGLFTPDEYLAQSNLILAEDRRALELLLTQCGQGLLFVYFSSLDLGSHVLWRHPSRLRDLYIQLDQAVGQVQLQLRPGDVLYVVSDHGFAAQDREFNLVNWLQHEGYLVFTTSTGRSLAEVDWTRTRAYALGFQSLYINLQGRERTGIVSSEQYPAVVEQIRAKLLRYRDGNRPVFAAVHRPAEIYVAERLAEAPDLVLGYARTFGPADDAALGIAGAHILADRVRGFVGNHACDAQVVPGVLFTNRKLQESQTRLEDVTASVLEHFGVEPDSKMTGRPLK